jgi:hypothetical protein
MDLSNPARIIMPSVTGAVLRALSHTSEPLSGGAVAAWLGMGSGTDGRARCSENSPRPVSLYRSRSLQRIVTA